MSRQENERRMRGLVARWRREGGSAAAFAAKQGVSAAKFWYWCRRVAGRRGAAKGESVEFRPVRLVEAATSGTAALEITFGSGERVLVHENASSEVLMRVIVALRTRC